MYLILSEISHIIVNERAKGEKHKEFKTEVTYESISNKR